MAEGKSTLECRALSVRYGQHLALDQVSIQVSAGEIVVILGANGAGKTSLLNALGGRIACADSSQILFNGELITRAPVNLIVEKGLTLVPEGRGIFADLSVRENLLLGAYAIRARSAEKQNLARVLSLFPVLAERNTQLVRTMSGGEQQMVAIGRALMSAPSLLMLDEPSLGLSPILCSELFRSLKSIRSTDVGILLVEQNARQALAIADRGYLLENGIITGHASAQELARDPAVQAAYLGGAGGQRSIVSKAATGTSEIEAKRFTGNIGRMHDRSAEQPRRSADELIGTPIEDLVTRADAAGKITASTQAEVFLKPSSLQKTLADIETAAVCARSHPKSEAEQSAISHYSFRNRRSKPFADDLPVIEVYRRPRIEIYKRDKMSKRLVKLK